MNKTNQHTDVKTRSNDRNTRRSAGRLLTATAAGAMAVLMMTGVAGGQELPPPVAPATPAAAAASAGGTTDVPINGQNKDAAVSDGLDPDGGIALTPGKSRMINFRRPYTRVSVGNPEIAAVNTVPPTGLLVTAKKAGSTAVMVWDDQNHSTMIDLFVDPDLGALRKQIKESFPGVNVTVSAANDWVSLHGSVPSQKVAEQLVELSLSYAKVHNFLEITGGQQVMLQVRFAEVSKTATRDLGVNFGGLDGISTFGNNIGQVSPLGLIQGANNSLLLGVPSPTAGVTLFGTGATGRTSFAYFLQALEENGLVRMLAEPNVMATSGKEAKFTAGGEFPVPVSQGGGSGAGAAVTVLYKEYGVKLNFTPIVMGDGTIRLEVNPEVSELDFANAVRSNGFLIPALTTRKLSTTVDLVDGQSLALAGLLNQSATATIDKVPLLGDVPVLGALFRSTKYQRNETELVVLVTPRLVSGMNPERVPTLPGERWRYPNDAQLYLFGDMGGSIKGDAKTGDVSNGQPPVFHGTFGFSAAGGGTVEPATGK